MRICRGAMFLSRNRCSCGLSGSATCWLWLVEMWFEPIFSQTSNTVAAWWQKRELCLVWIHARVTASLPCLRMLTSWPQWKAKRTTCFRVSKCVVIIHSQAWQETNQALRAVTYTTGLFWRRWSLAVTANQAVEHANVIVLILHSFLVVEHNTRPRRGRLKVPRRRGLGFVSRTHDRMYCSSVFVLFRRARAHHYVRPAIIST